MKRLLVISLVLLLLLAGCGTGQRDGHLTDISTVTVEDLSALFDENLHCVKNILVLGALPHTNTPVKDGHIYPVTNSVYHRYQELKDYLQTVYTATEVARLLESSENPLYLEIDGVLCVDIHRIGGKEYNVNWEGYSLVIDSVDDTACRFTVTGKMPTADGGEEPYAITGSAVCEEGQLVLEKILY